jgi:hypothetical protein
MPESAKQPYVEPQVIDHGDIRTLTQTNTVQNSLSDGGGTSPNIYAS